MGPIGLPAYTVKFFYEIPGFVVLNLPGTVTGYIIPAREGLVSDFPARDGNIAKLCLQCTEPPPWALLSFLDLQARLDSVPVRGSNDHSFSGQPPPPVAGGGQAVSVTAFLPIHVSTI